MKISSPFVDYIPECKKNMRKLRKKIYKFITSKSYHKKHQESKNDLLNILK
jgi:predicted HAD superfamily phosphohydrolase